MTMEDDDSFRGSTKADWGTPSVPGDLPGDPGESYLTEATPPTAPDATQFSAPPTELPTWLTQGGTRKHDLRGQDAGPAPRQVAFKMVRRVGMGGCGEVWEAVQESLGRTIAVKRLREDVVAAEDGDTAYGKALELEFRQEALTTARLEHPNIVPVHDFGQDEMGRPLLAMKLVKGKPWSDLLRQDEVLPVHEFLGRHLPILIDVAQAISFAHSKGIIHRDLKPSQVMVGRFGEVMLMDWGLAVKCLNVADVPADTTSFPTGFASNLQTARNPAGTPAYMAPEQTLESAKELGTWTDIFLLGGVLYRILTLSPPYNGPTAEECFAMARLGEVQSPRKRASEREIPKQLSQLAMACLQSHPQDRIQSAQEFIEGLQSYMSGAGKRQEAEKILAQVEEMLQSPTHDYRVLSRAHHLLERARALWPESRQVVELRDKVLGDYTRLATESGDLMLARLQAEQLRDESERQTLLDDIGVREGRIRRHARQRRHLVVVIVVMVAGLGAVLWMNGAERRRKAEQLSAQNDILLRQRNTGWDMMEFMLNDLQNDLASAGSLDVLEGMALKSVDYFDRLSPEQVTAGVLRQKSLAWRNLGEARLARGDLKGAVEAFGKSRQTAAEVLSEQPNNGPYLSDLAERRTRLGLAHLAAGDLAQARDEIVGAAEVRRKRIAEHVDDAELMRDLCESLLALTHMEVASGNVDAALQNSIEARDLLAGLVAKQPEDAGLELGAARGRQRAAELLLAAGRPDEANENASEAKRTVVRLAAANPADVRMQRDIGLASRVSAAAQIAQGNLVAAASTLIDASRTLDPLYARLPDDAAVLTELSRVSRLGAEIEWRLGRFEKARPLVAEAIARIDQAIAIRPSEQAMIERADLVRASGEIEWQADRPADAIAAWREARAAMQAIVPSSAVAIEHARASSSVAAHLALALASTGECEESASLAGEATVTKDKTLREATGAAPLFAEIAARSAAAMAFCAPTASEAKTRWEESLAAIEPVPAERRPDSMRCLQSLALLKSGKIDEGAAVADGLMDRHADDPMLLKARREATAVAPSS